MYQTSFINKTPSAEITVNVKISVIESHRLTDYENKHEINKLCMTCPTYGGKWSCPPFSPAFSSLDLNGYPYAAIVLLWCSLDQFRYTKTEYIRIKAANTILKSRMDRLMRGLEKSAGGLMISNGTCRLCNPCRKKKGESCRKPDQMRYSMEALGLDVGRITSDVFGHDLQWYKNKTLPSYLSAAACLLLKDRAEEAMIGEIADAIFSA